MRQTDAQEQGPPWEDGPGQVCEQRLKGSGQRQWSVLVYFIRPLSSISEAVCLGNAEPRKYHNLQCESRDPLVVQVLSEEAV